VVVDVRDPLRPSSRFSLLANVSITATFTLEDRGKTRAQDHVSRLDMAEMYRCFLVLIVP
jgi:hypothetical protein